MKRVKVFLSVLPLAFTTISGQNIFNGFPETDSIIKEDSMNLAILMVDFMTYQFESSSISYYTKCNNDCDADSLPFLMYFDGHWDFAHVYFHYSLDSALLFKASIHWMGMGQIEYPVNFVSSQNFPYIFNTVPLPDDAQYYNTTIAGNFCSWDEYVQRANSAWH